MPVDTNLASVRQRIAQACARSGRDPSAITLVCVTKGVRLEVIRQALAALRSTRYILSTEKYPVLLRSS